MATLATVALEFCRECLGWKDAAFGYESLYDERANTPSTIVSHHPADAGEGRTLEFSDLSAVLAAARQWCDKRNVVMKVSYLSLTGKHYASWTWDGDQINYACEILSELPAYVMDGCVDVELRLRRRREPAPGELRRWKAARPAAHERN